MDGLDIADIDSKASMLPCARYTKKYTMIYTSPVSVSTRAITTSGVSIELSDQLQQLSGKLSVIFFHSSFHRGHNFEVSGSLIQSSSLPIPWAKVGDLTITYYGVENRSKDRERAMGRERVSCTDFFSSK